MANNDLQVTLYSAEKTIDLTANGYMLYDIAGTGITTDIHSTPYVGLPGSYVYGSRVPARQITLMYYIMDTYEGTIRKQNAIDTMCVAGRSVRLTITQAKHSYYITGKVSKITPYKHNEPYKAQLVLDCADPYFYDSNATIVDVIGTKKCFKFPFKITERQPLLFGTMYQSNIVTIHNAGSVATGITATINVKAAISYIQITNLRGNYTVRCNYAFVAGDVVTVDTTGVAVVVILQRNNTTTTITSSCTIANLIVLTAGYDNPIKIDSSAGAVSTHMDVSISYSCTYQGV